MDSLLLSGQAALAACFLYASGLDVKTKTVPNRVWVLAAASSAPVWAAYLAHIHLDLRTGEVLAATFSIQFGLVFFTAVALYWAGVWGGADSKAFWALAAALPPFLGFSLPVYMLYLILVLAAVLALLAAYNVARRAAFGKASPSGVKSYFTCLLTRGGEWVPLQPPFIPYMAAALISDFVGYNISFQASLVAVAASALAVAAATVTAGVPRETIRRGSLVPAGHSTGSPVT